MSARKELSGNVNNNNAHLSNVCSPPSPKRPQREKNIGNKSKLNIIQKTEDSNPHIGKHLPENSHSSKTYVFVCNQVVE